ncbi:MAG: DUF7670 domain-containing protein [Nanoarchaeota archaeon]
MQKIQKKKINKYLYWTPRILSILFILFLMLFSLDIFDMKLGFWGTILGLLIHNIPAFVLIIILVISWKHEIVGGVGFISAGFLYMFLVVMNSPEWYKAWWIVLISGPAFLIGILFIVNWMKKKI